jgi:hypothetical protein
MAKPAKGSVELCSMEWLAEVCRDEASFPRRHHPLAVAAKVTRAQPGRSFDKLGISGRPFSTIGSSARRRTNRVFQSYDDILDHCCFAWNTRIGTPCKIMSIGSTDWGLSVLLTKTWYTKSP